MAQYREITPRGYAYAEMRVGVMLRHPNGREIYFQPGDDTKIILGTLASLEEVPPSRRDTIADMTLSEYFEVEPC